MFPPQVKTTRWLETIQLVLTFVSVCSVADASLSHAPPDRRPGYYAPGPQESDSTGDRRLADLARVERKRREAEQHASRRRLRQAPEQRQSLT
jgi:hypothetical protein